MAWNPSPNIIAIGDAGQMEMATYGETQRLCAVAKVLGDAAWDGIQNKVANP